MTTPSGEGYGAGSEGALDRLARALEERNEHIDRLVREVADSTREVRGLRRAVDFRPTRREVAHRRRVSVFLLALFGVLLVFGHEEHIKHCSPGARVVHGVDYLLQHPAQPGEDPLKRQSGFQRAYNSAPGWCDVTLPLDTHDGSPWPSSQNDVGLVIYLLLLASGVAYAAGPYRWQHYDSEDAREEPVA